MTTPTQGEHAQPEALRIADALASNYFDGKQGRDVWDAAAAELRRLHAQVAALTAAPQGGAYVENPAEIEHVAGDVSKNRAESNMTGGAYAELPEEQIVSIYERYGGEMMNCARAIERAVRASHGQAPAGKWSIHFEDERDFCLTASPFIGATYVVGSDAVGRLNTSAYGRSTFGKVSASKPAPTAQPAPAAGAVAGPGDYVPMLDDEGRAMVGTSHHYTAENIRALVAEYKALEAGGPDTRELYYNTDHRARAGVLWRVISALADEIPFAAAPTPAAQGDAWPSDDEVRAAYKDAFGLTPAGAIWLNLGILAEAMRTRRAALAQKEGKV